MSKFETLKRRLSHAVAVDDVEEKTRSLAEGNAPGYFDGLNASEVLRLKTMRSDVWRTRLEVAAEQTSLEAE